MGDKGVGAGTGEIGPVKRGKSQSQSLLCLLMLIIHSNILVSETV